MQDSAHAGRQPECPLCGIPDNMPSFIGEENTIIFYIAMASFLFSLWIHFVCIAFKSTKAIEIYPKILYHMHSYEVKNFLKFSQK